MNVVIIIFMGIGMLFIANELTTYIYVTIDCRFNLRAYIQLHI